MEHIFSEYFRSLDPGSGSPPPDLFDRFWNALAAALKLELQRRRLWEGPPRYLGIEGEENWTLAALQDLTADCYVYILSRLRGLKQQLKIKPNIDGLIILNIRHFLHERQKRHDPLGFRIFELLRSAVRQAVADGVLEVVQGDAGISNGTLLAAKGADSGRQSSPGLDEIVQRWNGQLIPDLVKGRGERRQQAVARLCSHLSQLAQDRIGRFRFKDLADALKKVARSRWQAVWKQDQGEVAVEVARDGSSSLVPVVALGSLLEERDSFLKLAASVSDSLEGFETDEATRGYLLALWEFLKNQSPDPALDLLPSRRKIAAQLGIPRGRLPGLFATLGQIVQACRAARSQEHTTMSEQHKAQ